MIAAVLLAAGSARRFGGTQKLLAPVPWPGAPEREGKTVPLVRLSLLGLRDGGIERVVVVLGRDAEQVRECLADVDPEVVVNSEYRSGMSSSVRAGVETAMRLWPDSEGLLLALGDQPLVGSPVVPRLVRQFTAEVPHESGVRIVAPRYRGEQGTPVVFARELVPELLALSGDYGARSVVERAPERVQYVDFDREAPMDVDTPADLAALATGSRFS